jgi:prepilin-type N-terminal cleavage/methylation domain-containing protein
VNASKKGFTIIELLIATTVFSVILLLISAGLIYIGKVYYRTTEQTKTQEATRAIISEITQAVRFSGGDIIVGVDAFCVGDIMFVPNENVMVIGANTGLVRSGYTGTCQATNANPTAAGNPATDLVPKGMFLREFTVTNSASTDLYTIKVHLVSLPDDESVNAADGTSQLFDGTYCRGGPGSEYCASSVLETTIKKRI